MKGSVKVVAKSHKVPSAQGGRQGGSATQVCVDAEERPSGCGKTHAAPGTVDVGAPARRRRVLRLLPGRPRRCTVGTTLKFRMTAGHLRGAHRDRGPRRPGERAGLLPRRARGGVRRRRCPRPRAPSTRAIRRRPSGGPDPDAARQRVLEQRRPGRSSATPLPRGERVTFAAPGTYTFYCLIHPFMKGTVVVPVRRAATIVALLAVHGGGDFGRRPRCVRRPSASTGSRRCRRRRGTWSPNERDAIHGMPLSPSQTVFPTVVYRRYTRALAATRCATSPRARATRT